jgi:hypothetical protein
MGQQRLLFGLWEPDSNEILGNGRAHCAVNVVPVKGGYKAINGWNRATGQSGTVFSTGVFPSFADNIMGAINAKDGTGATIDFIADTAAVYMAKFVGATVSVVTGAASATVFATGELNFKDFTQFGNEIIITQGADSSSLYPAYYDMGSSSIFSSLNSTFKAKTVCTMRDFVVFGHTRDSSGYWPSQVRWCAFGNVHDVTPASATMSDLQDLVEEFGPVQRVVGGNETFVVCTNGVAVMTFVGGSTIMRFDYVHKGIGTNHPLSCVRVGAYLYMYARQGFVRLGLAEGDVQWIGAGRVDKEFRYLIELVSPYPRVNGYHDALNKGIGWQRYNSEGYAFFYSYAFDQWTEHGDTDTNDRNDVGFLYSSDISCLSGTTNGTNYGTPTATGVGIVAGLGNQLMAQNDQDNKAFVRISTGLEELTPGRRSVVDKVWPLCEVRGKGLTTPVLVISSFADAVSSTLQSETSNASTASLQSAGFFTIQGLGSLEGKYHRFVLSNSRTEASRANEQEYLGLDVEFFSRGRY